MGRFYFLRLQHDCSCEIKRCLFLGRKAMTNLESILKSRDNILLRKVHTVKAMLSSSHHVHMRELDHKDDWAQKNWIFFKLWCWRRLFESPWTARISNQSILKETKPEYSLKDWYWSSNTLVIWCEEVTHQGKDPDARKDWGQEEKGMTEDETVGCHHWVNRHEPGQTLGDSEGQGSLACCSSWGRKELDRTERLNNKQ